MIIERNDILFNRKEESVKGKPYVIEEFLSNTKIIQASYDGNLNIELKRPVLVQYQGERVEENQTVVLFIDDEASIEINFVNGVASVPLSFEEAGDYSLSIYPKEFTAQHATLEVTV